MLWQTLSKTRGKRKSEESIERYTMYSLSSRVTAGSGMTHSLSLQLIHEWENWVAKVTPTLEKKEFETNVRVWTGQDKLALLQ